jgi:hypothetical protein
MHFALLFRNCQVSGRARNHVTKTQVDEVVHVSNNNEYGNVNNMAKEDGDGAPYSVSPIATMKQDQQMFSVDEKYMIKAATNGGDQPISLSTTTSSTVDYVR